MHICSNIYTYIYIYTPRVGLISMFWCVLTVTLYIYIYIYVIICVGDGGAASCYMKLNDVDAGAWGRMEAFANMRIMNGP